MPDEVIIVKTAFHPVKWGSFIVRGLIALIIGVLVLLWTGIAVEIVATLFGILIIITAILAVILGLKSPAGASRSIGLLIVGILGLLVGIIALLHPWIAAVGITLIIALLMLFFGFIDLSLAIFHPEYTDHRLLLGVSGIISVFLGGVFFLVPTFGAIVLVAVYLGIFTIIYGILSIAIGIAVKGEKKNGGTGSPAQ